MLTFQGARTTIYKMTQDGQEERMVGRQTHHGTLSSYIISFRFPMLFPVRLFVAACNPFYISRLYRVILSNKGYLPHTFPAHVYSDTGSESNWSCIRIETFCMRTTIEQYYQPFKLVCIVVPYFSIRSH
uniref:Ovule protein n=1 Tax=Heterorhabditis bacteriophora TaxID=37862 RepID=A0A1I7W6M3_HETBA